MKIPDTQPSPNLNPAPEAADLAEATLEEAQQETRHAEAEAARLARELGAAQKETETLRRRLRICVDEAEACALLLLHLEPSPPPATNQVLSFVGCMAGERAESGRAEPNGGAESDAAVCGGGPGWERA